jgi:hypothetical protein
MASKESNVTQQSLSIHLVAVDVVLLSLDELLLSDGGGGGGGGDGDDGAAAAAEFRPEAWQVWRAAAPHF